jgi:hypothetical protein
MSRVIAVDAVWDPDASVWVATSGDLRGLVTEAETIEELRGKLPGMVLDLLDETGAAEISTTIKTAGLPKAL